MTKRTTIVVAAVIIVGIGFFSWRFITSQFITYSKSSYSRLNNRSDDTIQMTQAAPRRAPKTKTLKPQDLRAESKDKGLNPPTAESLRKEIAEDPHGGHHAPASMFRFAKDLAFKMKEAKKSEEAAESYFVELRKCIDQREVPSIQALCLTSAKRLTRIYPRLQDHYEKLQQGASPEARKLLSAVNRLAGKR